MLVSCDANGGVNGTTAFPRWRWLKWVANWLCVHGTNFGVMLCYQCCQKYYCISYVQKIEMSCNMTFLSCQFIGVGIKSTWNQQHYQWHHCISWVRMIKVRCNMTFWSCDLINYFICRPHTTAHANKKIPNCNLYFSYYIHICANNRYVPQMP